MGGNAEATDQPGVAEDVHWDEVVLLWEVRAMNQELPYKGLMLLLRSVLFLMAMQVLSFVLVHCFI